MCVPLYRAVLRSTTFSRKSANKMQWKSECQMRKNSAYGQPNGTDKHNKMEIGLSEHTHTHKYKHSHTRIHSQARRLRATARRVCMMRMERRPRHCILSPFEYVYGRIACWMCCVSQQNEHKREEEKCLNIVSMPEIVCFYFLRQFRVCYSLSLFFQHSLLFFGSLSTGKLSYFASEWAVLCAGAATLSPNSLH